MFMSSHFQLLRDLIRHYLFFDQLAGCHNWGTMGTDGMNWLATIRGPLLVTFSADLNKFQILKIRPLGVKLAIFKLDIRDG